MHIIAVPNISGFGSSQLMGHLDFFPNGGEEMPGCKKNLLSQIVDLDGIWEGKARAEPASLPWGEQSLPTANLKYKSTWLFKNIQFSLLDLIFEKLSYILFVVSTLLILNFPKTLLWMPWNIQETGNLTIA